MASLLSRKPCLLLFLQGTPVCLRSPADPKASVRGESSVACWMGPGDQVLGWLQPLGSGGEVKGEQGLGCHRVHEQATEDPSWGDREVER